ncbi:hypothetical protein, partial [Xanthomonas campestris]|uniref:hypothetical protein n=1 Tax=Xanthomonas campestris TaxID=339 RepID=UPI002B226D4B
DSSSCPSSWLTDFTASRGTAQRGQVIPGQLTVPEYYCFEIMKALDIEADDQMNFVQFCIDWSKRYAVNLERYVPGEVLSSGSLDNSIGVKWKVTSADASCSRWWTNFQQNQCSL